MSKINQGILGGFSGKTGKVVGAIYRGVATMRGLPDKTEWDTTPAQAVAKKKFSAINSILSPFNIAINKGFIAKGVLTEWNLAVKANYKKLVLNDDGSYSLPPEQLSLSNGKIVFSVNIVRNGDKLDVSWNTPDANSKLYGADIYLVLHNPTNGNVIMQSFSSSASEATASYASLEATDEDKINAYAFAATDSVSSKCTYSII